MIEVDRGGPVWTVTLNRPEKANSLTHTMLVELAETMEAAQAARAVILTGRGKVFSAGADLDEARAGLTVSDVWERLSGAIAALPGITVCALNGTLAGGAMGMALACDLRIAVTGAKVFYPVMKNGFLPQPSDPKRMMALIGPARTKLILMGGARLTAEEALAAGLVERVVAPEALIETAQALVADAVAADPKVAAAIKALCTDTPDPTGMPPR